MKYPIGTLQVQNQTKEYTNATIRSAVVFLFLSPFITLGIFIGGLYFIL